MTIKTTIAHRGGHDSILRYDTCNSKGVYKAFADHDAKINISIFGKALGERFSESDIMLH